MLTCIDSRIDPLAMLGLEPGDAKILRNAGARVTDDVLATLVVARYLLDVERFMVIAHTDCRMVAASEDELHQGDPRGWRPGDIRSLVLHVRRPGGKRLAPTSNASARSSASRLCRSGDSSTTSLRAFSLESAEPGSELRDDQLEARAPLAAGS